MQQSADALLAGCTSSSRCVWPCVRQDCCETVACVGPGIDPVPTDCYVQMHKIVFVPSSVGVT